MAGPEVLQSAAHLSQKAGELSPLFSLDSLQHLAATLRSLGHPYGLLIAASPESFLSTIKNSKDVSELIFGLSLPLFCSLSISGQFGGPRQSLLFTDTFIRLPPAVSSLVSYGSTGDSLPQSIWGKIEESLHSSVVTFMADDPIEPEQEKWVWIHRSSGLMSYTGKSYLLSSGGMQEVRELIQKPITAGTTITPSINTINKTESLSPPFKEIHISKRGMSFGTTSLKLSTYRGQEPFVIKTPDGQPVTKIQPGEPLAALHVSHQASRFRGLPPLEKAHAIVDDVTQLLSAIDHTDPQTLTPDQQPALTQAKDATIIGISHLVRLFRRQTGLPTWKLDVLPPLLQRFHALDSQAVSNQFGGKRKVRPDDVEMLVITPFQRRQLVASLQS